MGNDLVLGNPARDDLPAIPQTAEEVTRVATILGCSPFLAEAATRAAVLQNAETAEHIHIACHCDFHEADPMASTLLLTDGSVAARDLLPLHLHASLVTLSACRSGSNDPRPGDELIGFIRALMRAGAPALVVSLWNTYDDSASHLMEYFYIGLRSGKSKCAALADAQRALRQQGANVAQWGAFVLIGDWR